MLGLKFLLRSFVIVDQCEPSAPSSTKLCAETKSDDSCLVGFVEGGKLFRKLSFRDVRPSWMEDIEDKLATSQKTVGDELARSQGYCG